MFLDWYSLLSDVCGLLQNLNGKVGGVRVVSLLLRKGGVQLKPQFVPMPDRGKGTIYGTLIALLCEAWNSNSRLLVRVSAIGSMQTRKLRRGKLAE